MRDVRSYQSKGHSLVALQGRMTMRLGSTSRVALNSLAFLGVREGRTRSQEAAGHLAFLNYCVEASARSGAADRRNPARFPDPVHSKTSGRSLAMSVSSLTGKDANIAAAGICAEVIPVPILSDNYAYLLIDPTTGKTACVDPAEPEKVMAAAKARGVTISTLLCTHKHWDHSGGNEAMKHMIPDLEVVSSAYEDDVPAMTLALKDQEEYLLGSLRVRALHTPCHTRGHVLFFVIACDATRGEAASTAGTAPLLFSGDTLFVGGCGRFFEGDASQMSNALQGVAAKLPVDTRVFCGHEYTVSNLQFAKYVEPKSAAISEKLEWSRNILANGGYTVPSTIAQELEHNPFMRVDEEVVRKATGAGSGVEAMKRLREMKNSYRPPPENPGRFPAL